MTQPDFAARIAELRTNVGVPIPPPPVAAPPAPAAEAKTEHTTDDGAKAELRSLDLLTIYRRWFNPLSERPGGGSEVNLSCFNTGFHAQGDRNPQFGINTAKNTYHCHACGISGDIIDLAANYYGLADGSLRCPDKAVHEAVKAAGEELLGMQFHMTPAGWQKVPDYVPMPVSAAPAAPPVPTAPPVAPPPPGHVVLVQFNGGPASKRESAKDLPADLAAQLPTPTETGPDDWQGRAIALHWRDLIPMHTPMYKYLDIVTKDDSPEEYHFWNFMLLIGLICGKDVGLMDSEIVYGNLLMCIVGQTGVGKSRSERHLARLIGAALPFDPEIHDSKGVKIISGAGSGEYMLREFSHSIPDPRATKTQNMPDLVHPGVRGLVKWDELSEMVGKASGTGSTIREKVMSLYDSAGDMSFGSITSGKTTVRDPFGSVATTTQPASIRKLLTKNEVTSGFLNRWLFVSGVPKKVHPRGTYIDTTPVIPDVRRLREYADSIASGQRGIVDLEQAAGEAYDRYILERVVPLKRADPIYGRVDLTFKKLTLLLAANSFEKVVTLPTVEAAKVVFDYLVRCYESFGASLVDTEENELHEAIVGKIRDQLAKNPTEGLAGHAIAKALKRKYDPETVRRGIRALEELGLVFKATPPRTGPGRRPTLYYIQED